MLAVGIKIVCYGIVTTYIMINTVRLYIAYIF